MTVKLPPDSPLGAGRVIAHGFRDPPLRQGITAQAVGLAWHFNPLERRDTHGRWTSGGSAVSDLPPGSFRRGAAGETIYDLPGQRATRDYLDDMLGGYYPDSPQIPADPELTDYVKKTVDQIPKMLGGGHEVWNGKVVTQDVIDGQEFAMAALDWHGVMRFKTSQADAIEAGIKGEKPLEPDDLITPLHELIHGNVPMDVSDYHSQASAYQNRHAADIEEGFTQLGAIQHFAEYAHSLGMDDKPTHLILPNAGPEVDKARSDLADALDAMAGYMDDPLSDLPHEAVTNTRKEARDIRRGEEIDTNVERFRALGGGADEYAAEHPDMRHYLDNLKSAFDALDQAAVGHTANYRQYAEIMADPGRIKDGTSFNSYPDQVRAAYGWVESIAEQEQANGKIGQGPEALRKRILALANQVNVNGPADKTAALAGQVLAMHGMVPHDLDMNTWDLLKRKIRDNWPHTKRGGPADALAAAEALLARVKARPRGEDITPRTGYGRTIDSIFGGAGKPGEGTGVIMSGHKDRANDTAIRLNRLSKREGNHWGVTAWEVLDAYPPNEGESPSAYGYRLDKLDAKDIYRKIQDRRSDRMLGRGPGAGTFEPPEPPTPRPTSHLGVARAGHKRAAGQKAADINSYIGPGQPVTGAEVLAVFPPLEGETPAEYEQRLHRKSAVVLFNLISDMRRGERDLGPRPKPKPFTGWKITGQHNIKAQAMSDRINAEAGPGTTNAKDVVTAVPPNPGESADDYGKRLARMGIHDVLAAIYRMYRENPDFASITGQAVDLAAWEHETRNLRGEWTHGASLNVAHGQERHGYEGRFMGYDPLNPPMAPADGRKPLDQPGRPDGAGTPDDPIDPQGNMYRAVDLLIAGKHVRLNGPEELPALANEINRRGDEVGAGVGNNPPWDLGNVSVKGTRLFTEQTTGIPRHDMPQLGGAAEPGSEAALLAGGANKFIELTPQFRAQLQRDGVDVKNERVNADQLRATQTGLTATTVTGIARAAMQGSHAVNHMLADPIWVSKDNYIIDGHHRWAAGEVIAAMRGDFAGRQIEVRRLNLPIALAVPYALGYAERMGIATKHVGGKSKLVGAANLTEQAIELGLAHWLTEKRGYHGEWVGGEGIALQALGIKSRKGWIRVPDRSTEERLPRMLRPHGARGAEAIANVLESMQAAQGPKQASMFGKVKSFLGETTTEGSAGTESPVPDATRTFATTGAERVAGLYGGGHETFNGQVTEGSNLLGGTRQAGALAFLDWDGSLHLRGDVADGLAHEDQGGPIEAGSAVTLLHELTHGVTDQRTRSGEDEMAYRHDRRWADAEEGFTQLGAIFHAREFFEAQGIADKPSGSNGADGHPLTMGELADEGMKRENVLGNPVWGIYVDLSKRAYLWAEQVAQQRGVPMSQIVDEINRLGTASKVSYIDRAGVPWQ